MLCVEPILAINRLKERQCYGNPQLISLTQTVHWWWGKRLWEDVQSHRVLLDALRGCFLLPNVSFRFRHNERLSICAPPRSRIRETRFGFIRVSRFPIDTTTTTAAPSVSHCENSSRLFAVDDENFLQLAIFSGDVWRVTGRTSGRRTINLVEGESLCNDFPFRIPQRFLCLLPDHLCLTISASAEVGESCKLIWFHYLSWTCVRDSFLRNNNCVTATPVHCHYFG